MADLPGYVRSCLQTGHLAMLAILVSGGIVLQVLACALYNNWWPMLTVVMYVILPMPLLFFAGSESIFQESDSRNSWVNASKFFTGASTVGSIAIPAILKHAGIIGWGALAMELSSFFIFVIAIMCYMSMYDEDGYSSMI
ncbi:unnamed protein product [Linum tenue]|uniref:Vacuolar protein sorting-associated protein 55 homolog n=1 Tax=Linum tenue TaxID=586396 RepID=A0AAV0HLP6_9ROSI|nr:unnamed protein product [Linum tenue]CAI0386226.1 unnamed protein product [Linum tenue]